MKKNPNPNVNPNNLDVDNLMSTMGQDIDYIFQELSTLEGQQRKKDQRAEGTDLPANPSPRMDRSDSDSDEQSLIATAKIKYTLGQLSSTLKKDENRRRSSSNSDPLLIDEDGFLVAGGAAQPSPDDAFGGSFSSEKRPKSDENRKASQSELLAAKRKELMDYQNQKKLRQSSRVRIGGTNVNGDRDNASKIDAVEAATKKRIEMLRRVVAEKAGQHSAADNKADRGGDHQPEDDELTHKLDFVEQETMKQISRLRKRYKSSA